MILRARVVLPMGSAPIEDGAVVIDDSIIAQVSNWDHIRTTETTREVVDLGDVVLLPGLINSHCHLEYTRMAGAVAFNGSFTDWLRSMVAQKQNASIDFFQQSWLAGAQMLASHGTTTVLDNLSSPALLPLLSRQAPVRIIPLMELIDVGRNPEEVLTSALAALAQISGEVVMQGLSPHATYTASPTLFARALVEARTRNYLLGCHVAESHEEWDCFTSHCGPLFDWLAPLTGIMDRERLTPVQFLERNRFLEPGMIITHANYLDPQDIQLMAERKVQVCHCPGSHDFFRHAPFEAEKLRQSGIPLCLGTDSLASASAKTGLNLSLFPEMRLFRDQHPTFSPYEIVKMATLAGAEAAGLGHCLGKLAPGYLADMIAIPFRGPIQEFYDEVIQHEGPVGISLVNGRIVQGRINAFSD